jgi:magnesium chelatase family protein
LNSAIAADVLDDVAPLSTLAMNFLRKKLDEGQLSGRGYHRVRRVARTLADMNGEYDTISEQWVELACSMRVAVMAAPERH